MIALSLALAVNIIFINEKFYLCKFGANFCPVVRKHALTLSH